jgi:hypothetical protein
MLCSARSRSSQALAARRGGSVQQGSQEPDQRKDALKDDEPFEVEKVFQQLIRIFHSSSSIRDFAIVFAPEETIAKSRWRRIRNQRLERLSRDASIAEAETPAGGAAFAFGMVV